MVLRSFFKGGCARPIQASVTVISLIYYVMIAAINPTYWTIPIHALFKKCF